MSDAWKKHDRPCPSCPGCGTELYEKFFGNGGWSPTDKATGNAHGPEDCVKVLRGLSGDPYWLIEYREDGRTTGYLRDLERGDGGLNALMTRASAIALRFDSASSAQAILDDWAFQRTVPHAGQFAVAEHLDARGPARSEPAQLTAEKVGT